MALPELRPDDYEDNYPYEKLTDEVTANINRMRDRQMRALRNELQQVKSDLFWARRRLNLINSILPELGIDIDVIVATRKVFNEQRK